jgi:hypothetical protein
MLQRAEQSAFEKLAQIAGVDVAQVGELKRGLEPLVQASWAVRQSAPVVRDLGSEAVAGLAACQRAQDCLDELCEAAHRYLEARNVVAGNQVAMFRSASLLNGLLSDLLNGLDCEPSFVVNLPRSFGAAVVVDDAKPAWIAAIEELAASRRERPSSDRAREPSRGVGRPRGSRRHLGFHRLVRGVLAAVDRAGGALAFSDNNAEGSTLWAALQALEPVLPPGTLPRTAPASRLRSACEGWRERQAVACGKKLGGRAPPGRI